MGTIKGSSQHVIDLFSPTPSVDLPPQNSEVACPAQEIDHNYPLHHTLHDTTKIEMFPGNSTLFKPPAFTLDLFSDLVDNEDQTFEEEPEVLILQQPDGRTLLPGFTTPEQMPRDTPSLDDTVPGVLSGKPENGLNYNDQKDDGYDYDDDDELGVFARRFKRPKPFRPSLNPFITTPRVPTLTQQGRRLPKELRTPYRRTQQDIFLGEESYQDFDYPPSRRSSTLSYRRVHTTMPSTKLIPTGGGGYLVTNSFMTSAQCKRLEQQKKIDKVLTDLEECVAACPTDVKLQGKLLHLRALRNRLEQSENTILKGQEAALIKDVEKMLQRRRMNMVKAEFESQARAIVENMSMSSSAGTQGRKRAYDEGIGSMSPLSSNWSETVAPSERSSSSHPSTGGKTVPQAYYQRRKRARTTYKTDCDADDEEENNKDEGEDVVWEDEHGRKTYGGKTIAQGNALSVDDEELAKLLTEAIDEEPKEDKEKDREDGSDDDEIDGTSDENTDDERDTGGKDNNEKGNDDDNGTSEEGTDEKIDTDGKGSGRNH